MSAQEPRPGSFHFLEELFFRNALLSANTTIDRTEDSVTGKTMDVEDSVLPSDSEESDIELEKFV